MWARGPWGWRESREAGGMRACALLGRTVQPLPGRRGFVKVYASTPPHSSDGRPQPPIALSEKRETAGHVIYWLSFTVSSSRQAFPYSCKGVQLVVCTLWWLLCLRCNTAKLEVAEDDELCDKPQFFVLTAAIQISDLFLIHGSKFPSTQLRAGPCRGKCVLFH